jgi:multidrug efflux pump subunit AcrB
VDAAGIENAPYSGFGPRWSSTIYGPLNLYRLLLELDPQKQTRVDSLEKMGFTTPGGAFVPLPSVLNFKEDVGPQTIKHSGQLVAERARGMTPMDAIYAGCIARLRPIMMTTTAELFGALPIAFSYGAGGG